MRIACLQMESLPFQRERNLVEAGRLVTEAALGGASLAVLPEYFANGCAYDRRLVDTAEPLDGPTVRWMQSVSRATGVHLAGGIVERDGNRVHNTLVLASPGGELWTYRKRYLPFFEKLFFTPGRDVGLFETPLGRIGVMICWDMIHGRLVRELRGQVDLLLVCAAWPDVSRGVTWHPWLASAQRRLFGRPRLLDLPTAVSLPGVAGWLSRPPVHRPRALAERLGVPVAFCSASGRFETRVPWLAGVRFDSPFAGASAILQADGRGTVGPTTGEAIVVGDVGTAALEPARAA